MNLHLSDLAWRNLVHDKVRLAVTLTGIVFAVVLIVVELGLFLGFLTTTSGLIDRSGADLWITASRVPYIEQGVPFSERKLYTVLSTPGVAVAAKYIARFSQWQRPDGRQESVQIVGFDPDHPLGGPWNVVDGNPADLKADQTVFILVKAAPGVPVDVLRARLAARLRNVDIRTNTEFSHMTQVYWMFTTGAGVAVLLAALLGLVVGVVVVAQTIYATTMDHLREYGTLKAMGASNGYLYRVIIQQAVISAVAGYALAMGVSHFVVLGSQHGGAAILLPLPMAVGMLGLTLAMCIGAALVSINKVTRLDPAMVFKG